MRKFLLSATTVLLLASSSSAEVVGRIGNLWIVKSGKEYRICRDKSCGEKKSNKIPAGRQKKRTVLNTSSPYQEIVWKLENGGGDKVYTRINGFDVERVLDEGRFFGAVIKGKVNEKELKRVFKYVVRKGNRYYVVGEWK